MADVVIKVDGFEETFNKLDNLEAWTTERLSDMLSNMGDFGVLQAQGYEVNVDTGATLATIRKRHRKGAKTTKVTAGGAAVWLEFGTGVAKNSGNNHPIPYDSDVPIYSHGGYGKHQGANPNGWFYYDENHKLRHTKGIRANMFMYRAYEAIVRKLPDFAREAFKK